MSELRAKMNVAINHPACGPLAPGDEPKGVPEGTLRRWINAGLATPVAEEAPAAEDEAAPESEAAEPSPAKGRRR